MTSIPEKEAAGLRVPTGRPAASFSAHSINPPKQDMWITVRYLKNKNCFTVVATHDLKMVEHIREIYETYCFKSFFTESGVTFDYKIRKGICNETNAIELLSQYKFPAVLLEDAKKFCRGLYS